MCIPTAMLGCMSQSRASRSRGATLPLCVALARCPWFWGPQAQGSSTRRSLVSTGTAEPTLKRNKAHLASQRQKPKVSKIQDFLALDIVYILEQAECCSTERPQNHHHLQHFPSMDLQVTWKELFACLRILFSPSFLADC